MAIWSIITLTQATCASMPSQGQSLKHVGLDLRTPVFSHGQLYVGLSWCTSGNRWKISLRDVDGGRSANVVYNEALTGLDLQY